MGDTEEIDRVFREYRRVLKQTRFQTPLQRVQKLIVQKNSAKYSQKAESDASRIWHLLPPGQSTQLSVDLLGLVATEPASLLIPITLLYSASLSVLLRTGDSGQVVSRTFGDEARALQAFQDEVHRAGTLRPNLPQFAHKLESGPSSLHVTFDSAALLWRSNSGKSQRLQQYIQPASKQSTLLRVHWQRAKKAPVYYFISQRGTGKPQQLPSLLAKVVRLERSSSEPDIQDSKPPSGSTLVVQRAREMPELTAPLAECARVLDGSLRRGQQVTEMVCDFAAGVQRKWVFLRCAGFTFSTRKRPVSQLLAQNRTIDVRFLMYPVVANRYALKRRLRWNNTLQSIAVQHKEEITHISTASEECGVLGPSKTQSYLDLPDLESEESKAEGLVESLVARDLSQFESLLRSSQQYKVESRNKVDFVELCGGPLVWLLPLRRAVLAFQQDGRVRELFQEQMGPEAADMKACTLLRVLKGDYSFYYKEALRKTHDRVDVRKEHFGCLLEWLRPVLVEVAGRRDAEKIEARILQLEEFIRKPL